MLSDYVRALPTHLASFLSGRYCLCFTALKLSFSNCSKIFSVPIVFNWTRLWFRIFSFGCREKRGGIFIYEHSALCACSILQGTSSLACWRWFRPTLGSQQFIFNLLSRSSASEPLQSTRLPLLPILGSWVLWRFFCVAQPPKLQLTWNPQGSQLMSPSSIRDSHKEICSSEELLLLPFLWGGTM